MQNIRLAYVAAAIGAATMPAAAQQEITLTVAAGQPLRAMNPLNLVSEFYIPEVNKRIEAAGLDIKIDWKEAYAGSLLKPTFVLQGVSDGIADIGFEPTIFHPDKLPLEQVSFMTPFTTTDVVLVGKTIDKLHATIPEFARPIRQVRRHPARRRDLRFLRAVHHRRRCRNSRTSTA